MRRDFGLRTDRRLTHGNSVRCWKQFFNPAFETGSHIHGSFCGESENSSGERGCQRAAQFPATNLQEARRGLLHVPNAAVRGTLSLQVVRPLRCADAERGTRQRQESPIKIASRQRAAEHESPDAPLACQLWPRRNTLRASNLLGASVPILPASLAPCSALRASYSVRCALPGPGRPFAVVSKPHI